MKYLKFQLPLYDSDLTNMLLSLRKYAFFGLLLLILFGCKRSEDKKLLVSRIRSAAKLATTEVVLNKVVIGNNFEQNRTLGLFKRDPQSVIFNTEATVKYGICLEKLSNKDVFTDGDSIRILLPPVEIINFSYPHEKFEEIYPLSDFYDIKGGADKIDNLDKLFRLAEIDIRQKLKMLNLEEEAKIKTINFLEQFLTKTGYYNINITFKGEEI